MLESNMKNINTVTSDVAYKIQTTINNTQDEDITISLGSFTVISILTNITNSAISIIQVFFDIFVIFIYIMFKSNFRSFAFY